MTFRRSLVSSLFLLASLLFATEAQAQFNRVFVAARSGNDGNTCNNIFTPCQTFAGAVAEVNAGGEVIVLESGGYGSVTIAKALTINAPAGIVAFVHPASGDGITINAGSTDTVILRGIHLNGGSGNGIVVNSVGQLFVEHCVVTGFATDGIQFSASGGMLFVSGDEIRACGHDGLLIAAAGTPARGYLHDSSFDDNGNAGMEAGPGSMVTAATCSAARNPGIGFLADSSASASADLTLDHVRAVSNGTGLSANAAGGGTATLRFGYCLVTQNGTGLNNGAGTGSLLGSAPGTSVVAGNGTNGVGSLGVAMTLD